MSQSVGFIGLGNIGQPMAECIVKNGFNLTVFDLRKEPMEALKNNGARVARSVKEVGELSDIIITMVLDAKQTENVILGSEGVLAGAKPGSLIIISSTISPQSCKRIAEQCKFNDVNVITAPVTGGPKGATKGKLSIMVDGDPRLMEKARPVLEAMGKEIFHFGELGSAQIVKAAKNLISNSQYIAINEAAAMVARAGIDVEYFFSMVRLSTADCNALHDNKWYQWWLRKFDLPETIQVTVKDTEQAVNVAKELGLHLGHAEYLTKMDIYALLKSIPRDIIISHLQEESKADVYQ